MAKLCSSLIVVLLLSACGQSGALYLPERSSKKPKPAPPAQTAPAEAPTAPAPAASPTP